MVLNSKRGQEGVTLTTILLLVLGVVVVILVILFATGFFNKVDNATGNLPSNLQAAVTACQAAAEADLTADYCKTLRAVDVNGKTEYHTCAESVISSNFAKEAKKITTCTALTTPEIKSYCENQRLKADTKVGDQTCQGAGAVLS